MCGAANNANGTTNIAAGLSPRVRGSRNIRHTGCARHRSIPTCAGQPCALGMVRPHLEVYPHVCGGTSERGLAKLDSNGLSPRVRGNRSDRDCVQHHSWSIPTCAGEPGRHGRTDNGRRVYPHVCGGTGAGLPHRESIDGLSPRVRGNLYIS